MDFEPPTGLVKRPNTLPSRSLSHGFWQAALLAAALPTALWAEPLTETRAMELGLNQSHFVRLLESQAHEAQGYFVNSQAWFNPNVELAREGVDDETETSFWLRQKVDFSGRRGLNQQAAERHLASIEASNLALQIQRKDRIRRRFYKLLFQQQQRKVFTHWVDKYNQVETAMEKREAAGDVSGYDRRRISRERAGLLAQQRNVEADYRAAWERLSGLIPMDQLKSYETLDGKLTPEKPPALASLTPQLPQHPALAKLRYRSEAARLSARAAGRSHIPDVTFGIGQKRIDGPTGDSTGLMLSASLPLPLFNRKQGLRQQATARAAKAESQYQLALQQAQADIRASWHQARQLLDNHRLFKEQSVDASYELVGIAETSYNAGEISVLELIDAYRSALDAEKTALELALQARLSRIDLDTKIEGIKP